MKFEFFPDSLARVRCDEGFEVLDVERFELIYREGERRMSIYREDGRDLAGEYIIHLGTGGLKAWLPPFDSEVISDAKRAEIRARVTAAIEFMGSRCDFTLSE